MNRFSTRYLTNASYRAVAGGILGPSNGKSVSTLLGIDVVPQAAGQKLTAPSESLSEPY